MVFHWKKQKNRYCTDVWSKCKDFWKLNRSSYLNKQIVLRFLPLSDWLIDQSRWKQRLRSFHIAELCLCLFSAISVGSLLSEASESTKTEGIDARASWHRRRHQTKRKHWLGQKQREWNGGGRWRQNEKGSFGGDYTFYQLWCWNSFARGCWWRQTDGRTGAHTPHASTGPFVVCQPCRMQW